MNSMIGKSTGIALLMAAALFAALFAMGVFSEQTTTVSAHACLDTDGDGDVDADDTSHSDDATTAVACTATGHAATHPGIITNASVTLSDYTREASDVTMTIVFTPSGGSDANYSIDIDFPLAAAAAFNSFGGTPSFTGATRNVTAMQDGNTLTQLSDPGGAVDIQIGHAPASATVTNYVGDKPITVTFTGLTNPGGNGPYDVTIHQTVTGTVATEVPIAPVNMVTDSTVPGKVVELNIEANISAAIKDKIIVDLKDFVVPSIIDKDNVFITKVTAVAGTPPVETRTSGNPDSVSVSDKKVTLTFGDLDGDTTATVGNSVAKVTPWELLSRNTIITFTDAAGVSLPIRAGSYDIGVSTDVLTGTDLMATDTAKELVNRAVTKRMVEVNPDKGKRGTEVTISAKGYSDKTHDVVIGKGVNVLERSVDAVNGEFTLTLDTAIKNNDGNSVFQGATTIAVGDAMATFTVLPSFTWSPESPTPGQDITITLVDTESDSAPAVTVGGEKVTGVASVSGSKTAFKGQLSGETPLGKRTIEVTVGTEKLPSNTITVGTNALTLSLETAVPGQQIDITGSGFKANAKVDGTSGSSVMVGGHAVTTGLTDETADGDGNISLSVKVPGKVVAGTREVMVKDDSGRIGTASITVPKPVITIDPTESRRGEMITVTGKGFAAGDVVQIKYNGNAVSDATPTADAMGNFVKAIVVPSTGISEGQSYNVVADGLLEEFNTVPVSAPVKHMVLNATVTASPEQASPGQMITITGMNFRGLAPVTKVMLGTHEVTPPLTIRADMDGTITIPNIQVLTDMSPNQYQIKVTAGGEEGVGYITITDAPVSNDPAVVFMPLVEGERLVRVWYLDRATQKWSFYDPNPEVADFNTLSEVPSGEVVTIIIGEGATVQFQGKTLFAGTNPVSLN